MSDCDFEPVYQDHHKQHLIGVLLVVFDELRALDRVAPAGSSAANTCERLLPLIEEALR